MRKYREKGWGSIGIQATRIERTSCDGFFMEKAEAQMPLFKLYCPQTPKHPHMEEAQSNVVIGLPQEETVGGELADPSESRCWEGPGKTCPG